VTAIPTHRAIEAVWKIEAAKIIAAVARMVRDVGLAEELAQDALVTALEQWPAQGVPDNPGAWLTAVAKNRALDRLRRRQMSSDKLDAYAAEQDARGESVTPDFSIALAEATASPVEDDLLRLMFVACHPVLSKEARVALTLRMLGELTTAEIARAYLVPEPTIAQRIVRAKKTLAKARIPFELPGPKDIPERLGSVLEAIYLIFNEGYAATSGADWMRPTLFDEALRLGRILAELAPLEPEVHGLVSLMEIQASRAKARVTADGEPILLAEQNRALWDRLLIRRGLVALARAQALEVAPGPYQLQAAIAACHARANRVADTDWAAIVRLYGVLASIAPSPVVELNRAVAVSMAEGPVAALPLVDALMDEPALKAYHLLPAVRGDLLEKLGRTREAKVEFERAAGLAGNDRERELLERRAAACRSPD
jgi:RNA polymerase sigma factor (sigma-70 family)